MDNEIFTVMLPDIGEGVVEGEVVEWLKQVGDRVKQDEPVVVVMTDKATVELPAPYPGILSKQYYRPGEISIKDQPLYDIKLDSPMSLPKEAVKMEGSLAFNQKESSRSVQQKTTVGKTLATPKMRGLAKELSVDIDTVMGTGKGGRVDIDDLRRHCASDVVHNGRPSPVLHLSDDEEIPLIGIRGLMAKKMAESHQHIPQFSYFEQVEAVHLIQLRRNFTSKATEEGIQLSYMPFLIRALSMTLQRFPLLNSCVDMAAAKVFLHKQHNIGIAMATSQGLIVPVLKGVQDMNLEELIHAYDSLKHKTSANKLVPDDMKEATMTITNFGVLEGDGKWATPIINYPEVAILGAARIRKEPVVRNHEVVIRDMLPLSWSFDHRVIDGELAVAISHHYSTLIRNPAPLL